MSQQNGTAIKCREDGCNRAVRARGLCKGHYNRWYRERDLEGQKARSLEWYYENRDRNLADPAYRDRRRELGREWAERNPGLAYRRHAAKKLGLTLEEYDAIQGRSCALCGTSDGRICVDHDHATGKVRDALCHKCNAGLGMLGDDPARLRAAADYIDQHRKEVNAS